MKRRRIITFAILALLSIQLYSLDLRPANAGTVLTLSASSSPVKVLSGKTSVANITFSSTIGETGSGNGKIDIIDCGMIAFYFGVPVLS